MSVHPGRAVRLIAILAAVAAVSLILSGYLSSSQPAAGDDGCANGRVPCQNTACVSACWADGTVHNPGTFAKRTVRAPLECGENAYGCLTQSCR